jgi:hypothetical protein
MTDEVLKHLATNLTNLNSLNLSGCKNIADKGLGRFGNKTQKNHQLKSTWMLQHSTLWALNIWQIIYILSPAQTSDKSSENC